jgi:hypothetical protein
MCKPIRWRIVRSLALPEVNLRDRLFVFRRDWMPNVVLGTTLGGGGTADFGQACRSHDADARQPDGECDEHEERPSSVNPSMKSGHPA